MSAKKILKGFGYVCGGLVVVLIAALAFVYGLSSRRLHRLHVVQARSVTVPTSADAIERGRHIVATRACADCHGKDFGGQKVIDDPLAGVLHGANLTRGAGGLPADYSDLDYVRAIRHGVARDGRPLILMPSEEYTSMTDEDVGAVIAYLKTVPAVDRARGPVSPGPIIRLLMLVGQIKLGADVIDHNTPRLASIAPSVSAEYGKYLATSCVGCHGETLAGGKIAGAPPDWPAAANLTPHESSRLKQWSEAQFIQTLRTGQRPDGSPLNRVMPAAFAQMTDMELKALWTYLSTLTPMKTGGR
ncbi:MAG: cytochrome c [Opitutus sp.]